MQGVLKAAVFCLRRMPTFTEVFFAVYDYAEIVDLSKGN